MKRDIVHFNPSVPKILLSKMVKTLWKGVIYSPLGPINYRKDEEILLKSKDDVITKTLKGGICGSDLHILHLDLGLNTTATIVPTTDPLHLGHEVVSEVIEVGENITTLKLGQRVVAQKGPSCDIHQPDAMCLPCLEGNYWLCEQLGNFSLSTLYANAGVFSTAFKYHKNQLFPVPDNISNDQAVLIEPLSCSIHGVLRHPPKKDDKVLIIGSGTIGLSTLASVKAIQPECDVTHVMNLD